MIVAVSMFSCPYQQFHVTGRVGEMACAKDRTDNIVHSADEWGWEGEAREEHGYNVP